MRDCSCQDRCNCDAPVQTSDARNASQPVRVTDFTEAHERKASDVIAMSDLCDDGRNGTTLRLHLDCAYKGAHMRLRANSRAGYDDRMDYRAANDSEWVGTDHWGFRPLPSLLPVPPEVPAVTYARASDLSRQDAVVATLRANVDHDHADETKRSGSSGYDRSNNSHTIAEFAREYARVVTATPNNTPAVTVRGLLLSGSHNTETTLQSCDAHVLPSSNANTLEAATAKSWNNAVGQRG